MTDTSWQPFETSYEIISRQRSHCNFQTVASSRPSITYIFGGAFLLLVIPREFVEVPPLCFFWGGRCFLGRCFFGGDFFCCCFCFLFDFFDFFSEDGPLLVGVQAWISALPTFRTYLRVASTCRIGGP